MSNLQKGVMHEAPASLAFNREKPEDQKGTSPSPTEEALFPIDTLILPDMTGNEGSLSTSRSRVFALGCPLLGA